MTPERKKKITLWIISVAAACILIFLGVQNISAVADAVGWCFSLVSSLLVGVAFALVINVPMSFLALTAVLNEKASISARTFPISL